MLRKLFRYDMKYTARLVLPLMLLTLGTTLLGSAAMKFLTNLSHGGSTYASTGTILLTIALGLIVAGSIFILVAFVIISSFIVFVRFYKNFFSDEGYLTHTLPIKSSTHMFSKTWSTLLWTIITILAALLFIFIYMLIGAAPYGSLFNTEILRDIGSFFHTLGITLTPSRLLIGIETVLMVITSIVFATFMIFTAITIGAVVAKKHKILAAIGFYYLINMAVSIATMLIFFLVFSMTAGNLVLSGSLFSNPEGIIHFCLLFFIVFYLALSAGGFALCNRLIKTKLNLA